MRDDVLKSQEYQLVELIDRLDRRRTGWAAIHIRLSRLDARSRRDPHLRLTMHAFERSIRSVEGQLFNLANNDLVLIYRDGTPAVIEDAVQKLVRMFDDDPMASHATGPIHPDLTAYYDVETQYNELKEMAKALSADQTARQRRNAAAEPPELSPASELRALGEFAEKIAVTDLTPFLRRQGVYAVLAGQPPQRVFQELFVSIAELRDALMPRHTLAQDPWLGHYLSDALDRRLLAYLTRNDDSAIASAFSLNLDLGTLLSSEFLSYDARLKQSERGTIVIELPLADVYADLTSYALIRDFLHACGYRVCLDGLTVHTAPFIDREQLGFDLVKLRWSQSAADNPALRARWADVVDKAGRARTILYDADTPSALDFGQSVGIAMFQGRHIDQIAARAAGR